MENKILHIKNEKDDCHKKENQLQSPRKDSKSSKKDCSNDRLVVKPEDLFLSSKDKSKITHFCIQKLFLRHISDLNKKIPKKITSFEEKYVQHWLELVHVSASRQKKVNFLPGSRIFSSISGSDALFVISTGVENFGTGSSGGPVFGSTGTKSPSTTPSKHQFRASSVRKAMFEVNAPTLSSGTLSFGSPMGLQNERLVLEDQRFSSTDSSSSSSAYVRGTLTSSWNGGFPRYVFSTDDQTEVYTANLSKVEALDYQDFDYIYTFYGKHSYVVAKMSVASSFTICPHGTETVETQFVLRAADQSFQKDMRPSKQKRKGVSKKMVDVFRHRTCSKFDYSFAIHENLSIDHEGVFHESPRFELCAVVVRDGVFKSQNEEEIGGWGLKFLRKDGCGASCCANGVDVVVPAGLHSEPMTKDGGSRPSGLVDRWRRGGSCDCGGWDEGCPLTILEATNKVNSFDLLLQGSKQSAPVLKLLKIHDGLYDIQHKSTLSSLQAFSIGVGKIHSQSSMLRPKLDTK